MFIWRLLILDHWNLILNKGKLNSGKINGGSTVDSYCLRETESSDGSDYEK